MDQPVLAISLTPQGCNTALDPSLLQPGQVAKMVNGQLERQTITTRPGSRVINVDGEWDRTLAVQGAIFYDPARGVGAQVFADDSASIFIAAGGRKYRIFIQDTKATSTDVTGEAIQDGAVHLIWMAQAENYVIAGDGRGCTYIFDGQDATYSTGFIGVDTEEDDRLNSSVPQGIRVPVYAHGRLWVVVDSRRILASDSLHGENQTSSQDLIKFTEQVYWATGQYFVPPSAMGNIIAAAILPTRDTRTGQGEIMFHCVNGGIFSIQGNIYPRENWANSPMVNHFLLDTAASGPYALDIQEGDQLFRSRAGIQTLRSAAGESRLLGRPLKPISEEVGLWLNEDYVPYLRFGSLINWGQKERLLCTVSPQVQGRHTYAKGLVVLNWDPGDSTQSNPAWEGLWTFPYCYRYPAKMVRGQFRETERAFGLHFNGSKYSLVEYDSRLKYDVLEDGTKKDIEMIVESREIGGVNPYDQVMVSSGSLHLRDISQTTSWSVDVRNDQSTCWTRWRSGEVCLDPCPDPFNLTKQQMRNVEIELGKPSESLLAGRRWQFRVTITGWARLEGLLARLGKVSDDDTFAEERLNVSCREVFVCCSDIKADFSYSDGEEGMCDEPEPLFTSAVTSAPVPPPPPAPQPPPPPTPIPDPDPDPDPDPEPLPEEVLDDAYFVYDLTEDSLRTWSFRRFNNIAPPSNMGWLTIDDVDQTGLGLSGTPSFSLNVWVDASYSGTKPMVSKGDPGALEGYKWEVFNNSLRFTWSNGASAASATGVAILSSNDTYMLTLVFTGGVLKMYVNGVEDYSAAEAVNAIAASADPFLLGYDGALAWFNGPMGLVGVWGRGLSPAEVTSIYNAGVPMPLADMSVGEQAGLVSFWHLNENLGTAIDSVGGNDLEEGGLPVFKTTSPFTPFVHLSGYPTTDGGTLDQWVNQTTNMASLHGDLNSGTQTDDPSFIGGIPVWPTSGRHLSNASASSGLPITQPGTLVVIATASSVIASMVAVSATLGAGWSFGVNAGGTAWAISAGSEISGGTADTDRHVFVAYFNGASSYLRVDGVEVATGNVGANTMARTNVGTGPGTATHPNPWLGSIELVIGIPRALTPSELATIELM